jgi:membrane-associated phospholipid phosphatase
MALLAVLAPLTVTVSRLYRGMHYLSDVIAGMALGAASLAVTYFALHVGVQRLKARRHEPLPAHVARLDLTRSGEPS